MSSETKIATSQPVQLSGLIKKLTCLSLQACQIIHQCSLKTTNIVYKSQEDPVTQIDHTIQKAAEDFLGAEFPLINIVGEEHVDQVMVDLGVLNFVNTVVDKVVTLQKSLQENPIFLDFLHHNIQYTQEELSIFIDPLDCTRGYVSGKKWQCTVLIGVAAKGVPIFGLIAHPYKLNSQNQILYCPRVLIGGTIIKQPYPFQYCQGNWTKINNPKENKNQRVLAVSCRRNNETQQNLIQELNLGYIQCGGSGNKIAKLIRGQVDGVIFLESPTSTWDSCAGQAIVLGMKGVFTKPNLKHIQYKYENQDQTNYQGFVCCLDQTLHQTITQYLNSNFN